MSFRMFTDLFSNSQTNRPVKRLRGQERRFAVRSTTRLASGKLWSAQMAFSKDCYIRNLSASGACLRLTDTDVRSRVLINPLTLYLPAQKKEIQCHLKWRKGVNLGVEFISGYRSPARHYSK